MRVNPLITRFRYSTLRRSRFGINVAIYTLALAVVFFINYLLYEYAGEFRDRAALFGSVFFQLLTIQLLTTVICTCYNTAGAIPNEISERSYDFFRMLPLRPSEKSLGIMIGRNLAALLISGVNVLLLTACAFLARVPPAAFAQYMLVLLGAAALLNTTGLLWSQRLKGGQWKEGSMAFVILLILSALFFMAFAGHLLTAVRREHRVWFYGLRIPVLLTIGFIMLYLAVWAFAGTLRRFRAESEPLFSRPSSFLFLFLYMALIFGFTRQYLEDSLSVAALFWAMTVLALLVIALLSFRNRNQYHELSGALHERLQNSGRTFAGLLLRSNVLFSMALFAAWFLVSLVFLRGSAAGFVDSLSLLSATFTVYLFLICLLEIYMLYSSGSVRIGMLVFFLMALYFVLPLVAGGILGDAAVSGLSPAALLWFILDGPPYDTPLWLIGAYNIALSIPLAAIIVNRYKGIAGVHAKRVYS